MFSTCRTVAHHECLYFRYLQFLREASDTIGKRWSCIQKQSNAILQQWPFHFKQRTVYHPTEKLECIWMSVFSHDWAMFTGEPGPHSASPAEFQDCVQKSAQFTMLQSSVPKHTKTFYLFFLKSSGKWTHWRQDLPTKSLEITETQLHVFCNSMLQV